MLLIGTLMIVAFVAGVFIGAMRTGPRQDLVALVWLGLPLALPLWVWSVDVAGGEATEWITLVLLIWWPPTLIGAAIGLAVQRAASDPVAEGDEPAEEK